MGILNYDQGCGTDIGCMGPRNPYYTIFNTEIADIIYPLLFSLIPTLIVFAVLMLLKKKKFLKLSNKMTVLILAVTYLLFFVWLAN